MNTMQQLYLERMVHNYHRLLAIEKDKGMAVPKHLRELRSGEEHIYLSTACLHGAHDYCGSRYNAYTLEPKKPATCKYCDSRCVCVCHDDGKVPALVP